MFWATKLVVSKLRLRIRRQFVKLPGIEFWKDFTNYETKLRAHEKGDYFADWSEAEEPEFKSMTSSQKWPIVYPFVLK
jgi:hypothetical protein